MEQDGRQGGGPAQTEGDNGDHGMIEQNDGGGRQDQAGQQGPPGRAPGEGGKPQPHHFSFLMASSALVLMVAE